MNLAAKICSKSGIEFVKICTQMNGCWENVQTFTVIIIILVLVYQISYFVTEHINSRLCQVHFRVICLHILVLQ